MVLLHPIPLLSKATTSCEGTIFFIPSKNTDPTYPSALSFLLINGAWDAAGSWATLTPEERATIKRRYATAGIKLIVSAFGSTDTPTSSGTDPVAVATTMGNWVKTNDLDGIDLDYEVKASRFFSSPVGLMT